MSISTCYDDPLDWMPRDQASIGVDTDVRNGFDMAVDYFCDTVDKEKIPDDSYLSMAVDTYHNFRKKPVEYGLWGFVYCMVSSSTGAQWHPLT